jgi:L-serine/L-threonine ammonia-lyase
VHILTPVIRSTPLSQAAGAEVWLLVDALQPSGSFKLRGVGRACRRAVEAGARALVSSSGGNAGLAAAVAGRALGVPVTVVVPATTAPRVRGLLQAEGATVVEGGVVWDEAHAVASALASHQGAFLVHPFEGEDLLDGHATLIAEALPRAPAPDVVVCAVGGGGLLAGVVRGLRAAGLGPTVVAAETEGAASYAAALAAGHPVTLPAITSIATTLGARRVSEAAVAAARSLPIRSAVCTDAEALDAVERFLDDHRLLVEPACGAALAPVYAGAVPRGTVWVVVCGGAGVSMGQLAAWRRRQG